MTLWIDVTAIAQGGEPITGVPRTRNALIREWIELDTNLRFFEYCRQSNQFYGVCRETVETGVTPVPTAQIQPSQSTAVARPKQRARRLLRHVGALLSEPFAEELDRFVTEGYRRTRALLRAASPPKKPRPKGKPIQFSSTDTVVLLDFRWQNEGTGKALVAERETTGFTILPLIYDLLPWGHPQFFPEGFGEAFTDDIVHLLRHSEGVLVNNSSIEKDIQALARERQFSPPAFLSFDYGQSLPVQGSAETQPPLVNEPYVLAVGGPSARKNVPLLYWVWRELRLRHGDRLPKLVFVGSPGYLAGDVLHQMSVDPLVRDKFQMVRGLSDAQLAQLYGNALFTVFPSVAEGYGLPLAESLAYGKFAIAADIPTLRMIGGDLVPYVCPFDWAKWCEAVESAWLDSSRVTEQEKVIRNQFQPHTWDQAARELLQKIHGFSEATFPGAIQAAQAAP